MANRKSTPADADAPPSFEQALAGLETIVEAMEHEHLALEDLVSHYEKGSALLARCESILQSARGRIELITLRNRNESAAGEEISEPTAPPVEPDADDDNDIRLF